MGEVDDSKVEGSDGFEDYELKEKTIPTCHIIVTIFDDEQPLTIFDSFKEYGTRVHTYQRTFSGVSHVLM